MSEMHSQTNGMESQETQGEAFLEPSISSEEQEQLKAELLRQTARHQEIHAKRKVRHMRSLVRRLHRTDNQYDKMLHSNAWPRNTCDSYLKSRKQTWMSIHKSQLVRVAQNRSFSIQAQRAYYEWARHNFADYLVFKETADKLQINPAQKTKKELNSLSIQQRQLIKGLLQDFDSFNHVPSENWAKVTRVVGPSTSYRILLKWYNQLKRERAFQR